MHPPRIHPVINNINASRPIASAAVTSVANQLRNSAKSASSNAKDNASVQNYLSRSRFIADTLTNRLICVYDMLVGKCPRKESDSCCFFHPRKGHPEFSRVKAKLGKYCNKYNSMFVTTTKEQDHSKCEKDGVKQKHCKITFNQNTGEFVFDSKAAVPPRYWANWKQELIDANNDPNITLQYICLEFMYHADTADKCECPAYHIDKVHEKALYEAVRLCCVGGCRLCWFHLVSREFDKIDPRQCKGKPHVVHALLLLGSNNRIYFDFEGIAKVRFSGDSAYSHVNSNNNDAPSHPPSYHESTGATLYSTTLKTNAK